MTAYAFPTDLLDCIKARWQASPAQAFALPKDGILLRLLDTCYHASLRTSERRVVECVVAYAPIEGIPKGGVSLVDDPVMLTDSELVRLSPVTQHRQTVIGCDERDGWLRIWGFFEYGHAWVQHSAGDPPAVPIQPSDFPPDCLTITIEAPGALTVSQGRHSLVRLRAGRVILPQANLFQTVQNPVGRFFHDLIADLGASAQDRHASNVIREGEGHRSVVDIYTTSLLAILERIRLGRHGGSVVITRVPLDEQLAHITYRVSEHSGLARDVVAYKALDDLLRAPHSTGDTAAELERSRTELALAGTSRQLIRGINQISLLAAVDGAVLLDSELRIQGFGVRFPVLLPPGTTVRAALTGDEYLCDQWGLRHQSVFSLCEKSVQTIGLIVSQDGDVTAVKAVDGQLTFWDGILD